MTSPNTPASAPVQTCPDCRKATKGEPGEHCIIRGGDRCIRAERDRLRQELATLQASHDAQQPVVDAAVALAAKASSDDIDGEDTGNELGVVAVAVDALRVECMRPLIEARDNATRLAATREVVDYLLGRIAAHRQGVSARDARDLAVDDVLRKYTAAEAQPVTEKR